MGEKAPQDDRKDAAAQGGAQAAEVAEAEAVVEAATDTQVASGLAKRSADANDPRMSLTSSRRKRPGCRCLPISPSS